MAVVINEFEVIGTPETESSPPWSSSQAQADPWRSPQGMAEFARALDQKLTIALERSERLIAD